MPDLKFKGGIYHECISSVWIQWYGLTGSDWPRGKFAKVYTFRAVDLGAMKVMKLITKSGG